MILIVSENNDRTTNEVINYLNFYKKKFLRVHENEIFNINIKDKLIVLESNRNNFYLKDITSVWYRRGGLKFRRMSYLDGGIDEAMNETQYWLEDYVRCTLENRKHINKESKFHVNKLIVLEKAKAVGLNVPKYFLSNTTNDIELKDVIIKPISGIPTVDFHSIQYNGTMYTSVPNKKERKDFFVTFFQEKIEKDFEIRTFYLDGNFWSMAIFSQNDSQTQVDFRKYNYEKPNRKIPYNLPKHICIKISELMHDLDINSGSIDLIKKGKDYYFLEVNPIGQFGAVSTYCNYLLNKKIAEYL